MRIGCLQLVEEGRYAQSGGTAKEQYQLCLGELTEGGWLPTMPLPVPVHLLNVYQ